MNKETKKHRNKETKKEREKERKRERKMMTMITITTMMIMDRQSLL